MKITYGVVKETYEVEGYRRTSYGIAAFSDVELQGASCILFAARDLSVNRQPIDALVLKINQSQLSEIHYEDIVNDFLASK